MNHSILASGELWGEQGLPLQTPAVLASSAFMTVFARYADEFPDHRETRIITRLDRGADTHEQHYLDERYCADPDCDCQRVMLYVYDGDSNLEAAITYDFEDRLDRTPAGVNPYLEPAVDQPAGAAKVLAIVAEELDRDAEYRKRLQRHYREIKERTSDPAHALWPAIRQDREMMQRLAEAMLRREGMPVPSRAFGPGAAKRKKARLRRKKKRK